MASDNVTDVWALISNEPARTDDKPDVVGWLERLCRAAARALPAMGVGVSVMSNHGDPAPVAASGSATVAIEDLQFTHGQGPCLDAYSSGKPVLTPDLSEAARTRWFGYGPAAHGHGVRAVFAFPLQIGAARLGVLNIYRDRPGSLSREGLIRALTFADVAMTGLLNAQQRSREDDGTPVLDDALNSRFELYQAQGMVKIQLGVSLSEALVRIRAYAYAHDLRLNHVADDIVARRLVLETDS